MLYPLYNYYKESDLSLKEIITHYIENFYYLKHGKNKVQEVLNKINNSSKLETLFEQSATQHIVPRYADFLAAINATMYFVLQSNKTQALACLATMLKWNHQINQSEYLVSESAVRDDAIKVFKYYNIYEEMSENEFESMTHTKIHQCGETEMEEENYEKYCILYFHMDCSPCREQDIEIEQCPILLPLKVLDAVEVYDTYKVNHLPTLMLVDGQGKEIRRWVGVTPTTEINDYLIENSYSERADCNDCTYDSKIPEEFRINMKNPEFLDKVTRIIAEGGTKEQMKKKLDELLKKLREQSK